MTISFSPILNQNDQFTQMAGIHRQLFDVAWSAASIAAMFEPKTAYRGSLVLDDDKIIGFIICSIVLDEAEIISMAIEKAFQQNGYGRLLLAYEIETLNKLAVKRLFLEVSEHNSAAQKLYTSMGFQRLAKRNNYYKQPDGTFADALVLSCDL